MAILLLFGAEKQSSEASAEVPNRRRGLQLAECDPEWLDTTRVEECDPEWLSGTQ
jgi:hypothetical protein